MRLTTLTRNICVCLLGLRTMPGLYAYSSGAHDGDKLGNVALHQQSTHIRSLFPIKQRNSNIWEADQDSGASSALGKTDVQSPWVQAELCPNGF